MKIRLLVLLAPSIGVSVASAQTKGVAVVPIVAKSGQQVGLYKGSYALVIGESRYTAGWPSLESVPAEMQRLEEELIKQGFQVTRVNSPGAMQLKKAFEDFIGAHGYDRENRLLVFYSGHGHTRQVGTLPKGYLVPSDAPDPRQNERDFLRKALPMDQVQTWAREIEAKHVLFLFDSCFAGTIFKTRALGDAPPDITEKTARPVRQFITAGSASEPVPAASVFLPSVIRGLQGEADLDHDGYVTGTELGEYLQKQVMGYRTGQTPQAGKIRDPDLDEGDFVFSVRTASARVAAAPPKGPSASSFSLDDVTQAAQQEESSRKAWSAKLAEMKQAAVQVETLEGKDVSPQLKQQGWERFLAAFAEKNPYGNDDEALRERARGRVAYWQGEQKRQAQEQQGVVERRRTVEQPVRDPQMAAASGAAPDGMGPPIQRRPAFPVTRRASPTLDAVRQRGTLKCGVNPNLPGFSYVGRDGERIGFDVDFCRELAAAIGVGIQFIPLTAKDRFPAIQDGQIDVLYRNTTATKERVTNVGLEFPLMNYLDGQGFMVRKALRIKSAKQLNGATVCVETGTTTERNLANWFRINKLQFKALTFEGFDTTRQAYDAGRCDALTTDATGLAAIRLILKNPAGHVILPERISLEPLSPVVRPGDEGWAEVVRWVFYAAVIAEEKDITQANVVRTAQSSTDSEVRQLLGAEGTVGANLNLTQDWAVRAIRERGNYGEIFERNLGSGSPLQLERGLNSRPSQGGYLYTSIIR